MSPVNLHPFPVYRAPYSLPSMTVLAKAAIRAATPNPIIIQTHLEKANLKARAKVETATLLKAHNSSNSNPLRSQHHKAASKAALQKQKVAAWKRAASTVQPKVQAPAKQQAEAIPRK